MTGLDELIVDRPKKSMFRVHRSTMTSPEILDLEQERIFDRCWMSGGSMSG